MRCSFRNTRAAPTKSQRIYETYEAPRVAQSCSLLRTGTYPCSVSERLRNFTHCQDSTAKTQRNARLNPSETDLPRFCKACAMPVWLYARTQLGTSLSSQGAKRLAISWPVAQLGARSVMLGIPLSQCYTLGRISPEYADGPLALPEKYPE